MLRASSSFTLFHPKHEVARPQLAALGRLAALGDGLDLSLEVGVQLAGGDQAIAVEVRCALVPCRKNPV